MKRENDPFDAGSIEILRETEPQSGEFQPIFVESQTFKNGRPVERDELPLVPFSTNIATRIVILGEHEPLGEHLHSAHPVAEEVYAVIPNAEIQPVVVTHGSRVLPPPNQTLEMSADRVLIRPSSTRLIGVELDRRLVAGPRVLNPPHAPILIGKDNSGRALRINIAMVDLPEEPLAGPNSRTGNPSDISRN